MISRFFIDRPIFAAVLSIIIVLAGALAIPMNPLAMYPLPIAMYPPISPPTVQVDCTYAGGSAEVVSEAIATPIEQEVNGVEGMLYMSSQCTNDGSYTLTVAFEHGVNLNLAQVLVQNRVNLALPRLPDVVKQAGVRTRKKSPDILMTVNIYSPDLRYDSLYLSNYAYTMVKEEIARVPGVGDISIMGQRDYSMRVWVNPERVASLGLTAGDIARALRDQNREVATGSLGQQPMPSGQAFQFPLSTLGRLSDIDQFNQVVVKSTPDGRVVRLKDVARVTLSAKNEAQTVKVDKRPSIGIAIFQLPDANALETADMVIAKMNELRRDFPDGVDYQISYDTTPYTRESIREVFKTLFDAIILVAAVVLLFLQNWRSAIIPLVAVPVAVIGTFAVMAALGFSLNTLTLFGLVLAIGIVVDDAIVVVEAVEHHIEAGLAPRYATVKAMEQVSGPVIAVGLVLSAVFVPCAFISGITGQFFRQFALTIAVSTIISAFNSLTLSPALAAILLPPKSAGTRRQGDKETGNQANEPLPRVAYAVLLGWLAWSFFGPSLKAAIWGETAPRNEMLLVFLTPCLLVVPAALAGWFLSRPLNWLCGIFFGAFNRVFGWSTRAYTRVVGWALRGAVVVILLYLGLLGLTGWSYFQLPRGFIPSQDMGYFMINVQLPDAASMERTKKTMDQVEDIVFATPGVRHMSAMSGSSLVLNAGGSNFGSLFVMLDEFSNRQTPEKYSEAIIATLRERFKKEVTDAQVSVFSPPPIRGVGRAGGFKIMIEDRGNQGARALQESVEHLVELGNSVNVQGKRRVKVLPGQPAEAEERKAFTEISTVFRSNVPSLYVDINRAQAMAMQVPYKDATDTMQIYLGSLYVNDFNLYGRTWQVIVQADMQYRDKMDDIRRLQVRNQKNEMVPLGSLASIREINGPLVLTRFNTYPAAPVTGNAAPGVSSGEAIDLMQRLALRNLPPNMTYEWTELAYLEVKSGNTAMLIFGFAVVMVFLVLAAQYESWSLPLAVILVVPMCILCALAGVAIGKQDINIFTQIGFVVLVGLASKNAILIVEFAKHLRESGADRREATLEACRLRLRPIVMTSLAFILGVLPLLISHGAGAEMRRTLGTAVFAGMLGVTLFGLFLTPVFFYVIDLLGSTRPFAWPPMRIAALVLLFPLRMPMILYRLIRNGPQNPYRENGNG